MIEKIKAEIEKVNLKIKNLEESPYARNLSGGLVQQAQLKMNYLSGVAEGLKKALEILTKEDK